MNNIFFIFENNTDSELRLPTLKDFFYSENLLFLILYFFFFQIYAEFIKKYLWLDKIGFQ